MNKSEKTYFNVEPQSNLSFKKVVLLNKWKKQNKIHLTLLVPEGNCVEIWDVNHKLF